MWKIENDVPVPSSQGGRGRLKYPWPDMESGDSIHVAFDGDAPELVRSRVAMSAKKWLDLHRPGWRATTSLDRTGVRIWLLEPGS